MLSFSSALRIFLATEPADMRKGFDGLSQLVRDRIAQDPLSGHLFVFRNKRRDRIKVLYWDRDGLALWYKRLEKGTFRFPEAKDGRIEVTSAEMAAILEGIDLSRSRRLPRFFPARVATGLIATTASHVRLKTLCHIDGLLA